MTNSYEMVRWIPFTKQKPPIGEDILVFSSATGVIDGKRHASGLSTWPISGTFTHWAKKLKGPSSAQLFVDWAISWVR